MGNLCQETSQESCQKKILEIVFEYALWCYVNNKFNRRRRQSRFVVLVYNMKLLNGRRSHPYGLLRGSNA